MQRTLRNPSQSPIPGIAAANLLLAFGLLFASTVALPASAGPDGDGAAGDPALAEVLRLVGQASCKSDAECRTVAVGARACGGPQRYLAWSASHTDAQALAAAVERADAQQGSVKGKGKPLNPPASTCVFIPDPGARCVPVDSATARQCVLGGGAELR